MGRKKISIREIENSRQRTVTFARRRAGIIKKAHELSILCGVKVAIVIFDSKNASHVYSSADTPEELFAQYLNKQFLTNESRKRKDRIDGSGSSSGSSGNGAGDDCGGTYGFDGNGSFIRRRLAVVNEYKVTSDGPNSRNLQVKYTKQYHNPNPALPGKRLSVASTASSSTATLGAGSSSLALDLPLADPALMDALPARSASLFRRGADHHIPSLAAMLPYASVAGNPGYGMGNPMACSMPPPSLAVVADLNKHADGLGLATRDLSTLSLLPGGAQHMLSDQHYLGAEGMGGLGINGNMLHAMDASIKYMNASPLSISDSSGSPGHADSGDSGYADDPPAKRQRSHSITYPAHHRHQGTNAAAESDLNQALVENFLADSRVARLLDSTWNGAKPAAAAAAAAPTDTGAAPQAAEEDAASGTMSAGTHSSDDDGGDEDDDDDDDDDDDEDDGTGDGDEDDEVDEDDDNDDDNDGTDESAENSGSKAQSLAKTAQQHAQHAPGPAAEAGPSLHAHQGILEALQCLEMMSAGGNIFSSPPPPPPPLDMAAIARADRPGMFYHHPAQVPMFGGLPAGNTGGTAAAAAALSLSIDGGYQPELLLAAHNKVY